MPEPLKQTNFAGGELSPRLWGRTDLAMYGRGLRTCRNFFLSKHGAAVSRPGTMLVKETKGSATAHGAPGSAANTQVRLIPFIFSAEQSYVLEFGDHYVRFHANGGTIENPPGTPLEIASPYGWGSLAKLQFAQVGNVMTLTHPGYDAYELRRNTHVAWTLTTVNYVPPAAVLPFFTRSANPPFWNPGSTGYASDLMLVTPLPAADATHAAREWQWMFTLIAQDITTGRRFETLAKAVTRQFDGAFGGILPNPTIAQITTNKVVLFSDKAITLRMDEIGPGPDAPYSIIALNIYRGRGKLFGLVGQTNWMSGDFVDVGDTPDYNTRPPLGTNPFQVFDPLGVLLRTERPMAVAFFAQRRVFGGAWDNNQLIRTGRLFLSAVDAWENFDRPVPVIAGAAREWEIASTEKLEIRSMLPTRELLLLFTSAGTWAFSLSASGLEDSFARISSIGASHIRPLAVEESVLFVRGKGLRTGVGADAVALGVGVTGLRYDALRPGVVTQGLRGGYVGMDLTWFAHHLFTGTNKSIIDWDYAQSPWDVIWAVRSDGALLSLTYSERDEVAAWARHDTDGVVENVCVVPEGQEDVPYIVVRRTVAGETRRYIERFTSRVTYGGPAFSIFGAISLHADDICLDSAKYYFDVPTQLITGLDHLEGKSVYVIGPARSPAGPFVVAGGQIDLGSVQPVNAGGKLLVYVGLKYTPELETLDVAAGPSRNTQKTLQGLALEVDQSRGLMAGYALEDSKLKPWAQLTTATGYNPITNETSVIRIVTTGSYNENARAALRQTEPLPVTVVGLTRMVDIGG